jgi:hypothetical protein
MVYSKKQTRLWSIYINYQGKPTEPRITLMRYNIRNMLPLHNTRVLCSVISHPGIAA